MKKLTLLLLLPLLACVSRPHDLLDATIQSSVETANVYLDVKTAKTKKERQAQIDKLRVKAETQLLTLEKQRREFEQLLEEDLNPADRKIVEQALDEIDTMEIQCIETLRSLDLYEKRLYQ